MDGLEIGLAANAVISLTVAAWVFFDARALAQRATGDVVPASPTMWIALCVFGLWLIALPLYLSDRAKTIARPR